jgi:transposase
MFIHRNIKRVNNKIYNSTLLMRSYRLKGKVKHKTITNLSSWPEELIREFELLLKGGKVTKLEDLNHKQGKSYGAIKVIYEIAKRLGIVGALGANKNAALCMLLIAGRILTNRSRLYLCNWALDEAVEEVLEIAKFNEDDLYEALDWLSGNQVKIEKKLFKSSPARKVEELFLYDVTSSYLEGTENELSAYGYNRDGKKSKKQIVIGLLTDKTGTPVSVEVFKGNTQDPQTVLSQIKKLSGDFGVEKIVFVGDRGMLKSEQLKNINERNWQYITAITKSQIEKLIKEEKIQLELFEEKLCEVEYDNTRYILRKNPVRMKEIEKTRTSKIKYINEKIEQKNKYLSEHPKASAECAVKDINNLIVRLKLTGILGLAPQQREIICNINKEKLEENSRLDGCYVIKTNVPAAQLKKEIIHDRYKELSEVEKAFRTMKTGLLEVRPIFLRKESRTRGHVFICMLSYMVTKYIWDSVKELDIQQEFIYQTLDKIQYITYTFENDTIKVLPEDYSEIQNQILSRLKIKLPHQL